jgi:hypothetical protein
MTAVAYVRRVLADLPAVVGRLRRGEAFEYVLGYVRLTWLPDSRVIILYIEDEYRGALGLRRHLRWNHARTRPQKDAT